MRKWLKSWIYPEPTPSWAAFMTEDPVIVGLRIKNRQLIAENERRSAEVAWLKSNFMAISESALDRVRKLITESERAEILNRMHNGFLVVFAQKTLGDDCVVDAVSMIDEDVGRLFNPSVFTVTDTNE